MDAFSALANSIGRSLLRCFQSKVFRIVLGDNFFQALHFHGGFGGLDPCSRSMGSCCFFGRRQFKFFFLMTLKLISGDICWCLCVMQLFMQFDMKCGYTVNLSQGQSQTLCVLTLK